MNGTLLIRMKHSYVLEHVSTSKEEFEKLVDRWTNRRSWYSYLCHPMVEILTSGQTIVLCLDDIVCLEFKVNNGERVHTNQRTNVS